MRLIDADALIQATRAHGQRIAYTESFVRDIMDAPTVGGWISVQERLPDLEEQVLIVYEWTGRSGEKYREIVLDSFKAMSFLGYKPLFWMPLPEPPEEVSGDADGA